MDSLSRRCRASACDILLSMRYLTILFLAALLLSGCLHKTYVLPADPPAETPAPAEAE